ncbi:hypothetical protein [Mucilaginibacter sp. FT3.2]|uniref:hypothetical protein n=1 Tax=Mucilaginibacter sp. FT3.2 TaxID=2723090 RepID=UPI00160AA394|nr:hypothetical protein [Mucilaginibacter sp. FT3.2]MBB6232785.1 hypothetical protein [Mucilaginibacter sp. FT3.2]
MNKKLICLAIAILVIINLLLLYKVSNANSTPKYDNSDSLRLVLNKYYHSNTVVNSQLNNNTKLSNNLLLTDINNKNIKLKALVPSGFKLIVRSSETGCSVCIENELNIIKKFAKIIGDGNIIVITTHSNARKLNVFKQTNNIPFKMYICPNLGMPFEKNSEKPFLFLLDADLTAQNFFIPEISERELSESYYSAIYKRYFKVASQKLSANIPSF